MKKIILAAFVALTVCLGCSKETTQESINDSKPTSITITINGNVSNTIVVK